MTLTASGRLSGHGRPHRGRLDLILAGLFELTITYAEDDEKRERCKALAEKLGGDPNAMFFGAQ